MNKYNLTIYIDIDDNNPGYINISLEKDNIFYYLEIPKYKFTTNDICVTEYQIKFLDKFWKLYEKKIRKLLKMNIFEDFVEFTLKYDLLKRKIKIYDTDEDHSIDPKKLGFKTFENFEKKSLHIRTN